MFSKCYELDKTMQLKSHFEIERKWSAFKHLISIILVKRSRKLSHERHSIHNNILKLKRCCLHNINVIIVIMVSRNACTLQLVILPQRSVATRSDSNTLNSWHVTLFALIEKRIIEECTHRTGPFTFADIIVSDEIGQAVGDGCS